MVEVHDLSIFYKNNIPIGMVLFNDLDEKNMSQNKIKYLQKEVMLVGAKTWRCRHGHEWMEVHYENR